MDEKAFGALEAAMDAFVLDEDRQKDLISEAKDLKTVVELTRKVTGKEQQERKELDQGPKVAIGMQFLRSAGASGPEIIDI